MTHHITIPDDFPKAISGTKAEEKIRTLGEVHIYSNKAETQEELIERIKESDVVINIRAYTHLTRQVLASCPNLRLISIWGSNSGPAECSANSSQCGDDTGGNHQWAVDGSGKRRVIFYRQGDRSSLPGGQGKPMSIPFPSLPREKLRCKAGPSEQRSLFDEN